MIIDVLRGWWFYGFVVSWVGGLMWCFFSYFDALVVWWFLGGNSVVTRKRSGPPRRSLVSSIGVWSAATFVVHYIVY